MTSEPSSQIRHKAEEAFANGLYCAESVLSVLAQDQGVHSDVLPKIATAFCSGMSQTCGTCGALTGAIMGVSLALGRSAPEQSVQPVYGATQKLIREFETEFGARDCHVLLGCDLNTPEGQAVFQAQQLGKRCLQYTGVAAQIAARVIDEHKQQ